MECRACGAWCGACPETGYDEDGYCPAPACQDARRREEDDMVIEHALSVAQDSYDDYMDDCEGRDADQ